MEECAWCGKEVERWTNKEDACELADGKGWVCSEACWESYAQDIDIRLFKAEIIERGRLLKACYDCMQEHMIGINCRGPALDPEIASRVKKVVAGQSLADKDLVTHQRDTAWAELREIREIIKVDPEEATTDEVRAKDMDCIQESIGRWARNTFPRETLDDSGGILKHMDREFTEFMEATSSRNVVGMAEEAADITIMLMDLMDMAGVSLRDAILAKMRINRERSWGEEDDDGVIEHIRKESPDE